MKLVLNSNYEEARKVASCFVGQEIEENRWLDGLEHFDGIFLISKFDKYNSWSSELRDIAFKITIDLSKSQPCIYQSMKYGLKVEVDVEKDGYLSKNIRYDFSERYTASEFLGWVQDKNIVHIKLLNLDQMEGLTLKAY